MTQTPLRVGLIGYGAIGQDVVRLLTEQAIKDIAIVGALVRDPERPRPFDLTILTQSSQLLSMQPDIVVEVAGHNGLKEHGPTFLDAGIDLLLVSVGAFADPDVLSTFLDAAQKGKSHLHILPGAIGGLDALSAASLAGLTHVVHTMRKPPHTLLAPSEAAHLTQARIIFKGNARQAAKQYPQFLNVAAAVALAGKGFDQTEVYVVADPTVEHSVHEVQAEGTFGSLRFEIENKPIEAIGRSAQLVAMGIVHALLRRRSSFIIG